MLAVVAILAALIAAGLSSNASSDDPAPVASGASAPPEPVTTPEPTTEASATPGETPTAEAESLADTVWATVLENFGGEVSSGSPLFAVTEVEDVSSGTIRVYVQENLDDAGREEVARHTFNMGAFDNDELQTVVVRDASGVDSNHYR